MKLQVVISSQPIKYSTGNSFRLMTRREMTMPNIDFIACRELPLICNWPNKFEAKFQACWGLTCAAFASAGIQTLYCVRNSTCGTPAASTRKAWSIKEFLLALTNKKRSSQIQSSRLIIYGLCAHLDPLPPTPCGCGLWHFLWVENVALVLALPHNDTCGVIRGSQRRGTWMGQPNDHHESYAVSME